MRSLDRKGKVALLSVVSNTGLVTGKLVVGVAIGSVSVISEAIHSAMDLLASIIAFASVRISGQPADQNHQYGHGKMENISGVVEGFLILVAAGWIFWEAAHKLVTPKPLEAPLLGTVIMLISVVVNIFVSRSLFKVGKETDSVALIADAWHLKTDVWTSFGVMTGLIAILAGSYLAPGWNLSWVDPIAAIFVAVLIVKAACKLTVDAGRDLLDTSLPDEECERIREIVESPRSGVHGIHMFKTRKAGHIRFVEFHIKMEDNLTVEHSHRITDEITDEIRRHYPDANVSIHVEPMSHQAETA